MNTTEQIKQFLHEKRRRYNNDIHNMRLPADGADPHQVSTDLRIATGAFRALSDILHEFNHPDGKFYQEHVEEPAIVDEPAALEQWLHEQYTQSLIEYDYKRFGYYDGKIHIIEQLLKKLRAGHFATVEDVLYMSNVSWSIPEQNAVGTDTYVVVSDSLINASTAAREVHKQLHEDRQVRWVESKLFTKHGNNVWS